MSSFLFLLSVLILLLALGMLVPLGKAGCMTAATPYTGMMSSMMKFIQSLGVVISTSIVAHMDTNSSMLPLVIFLMLLSGGCVVMLLIHVLK